MQFAGLLHPAIIGADERRSDGSVVTTGAIRITTVSPSPSAGRDS